MRTLEYSERHYNALPVIEELSTSLGELHSKLGTLGDVFRHHQVEGTLGVSLLHRHFKLEPGEHVVHHSSTKKSQARIERTDDVYPCVWQIQQGSLRPLEFTNKELGSSSALTPKFLIDFESTLTSLELDGVLGLTSLISSFEPESIYVETSDETTRCSTRTEAKTIPIGIETTWAFDQSGEKTSKALVVCTACRSRPVVVCTACH